MAARAEDGALVILASGPESVRDTVTPLFDAEGSRTMWLGPAGAGSRLKLVANGWVATVLEGVADALALSRDLGLDPALFLQAVGALGGAAAAQVDAAAATRWLAKTLGAPAEVLVPTNPIRE